MRLQVGSHDLWGRVHRPTGPRQLRIPVVRHSLPLILRLIGFARGRLASFGPSHLNADRTHSLHESDRGLAIVLPGEFRKQLGRIAEFLVPFSLRSGLSNGCLANISIHRIGTTKQWQQLDGAVNACSDDKKAQ